MSSTPPGWAFRDVQLELSLKPFSDVSSRTRESVCREIFIQWLPLLRLAEQVSILLWVGEGSEILEFDGNPESAFEWARYHGAPNRHHWDLPESDWTEDPDHNAIGIAVGSRDPDRKGIHCRAYLYRENPARFTYKWLARLVADLKRIGKEITGLPILVGQAFDIGPEFAKSRFKFDWHREILGDGPIFKDQFISCEAKLHADCRPYAAFPSGIPEGTPIGAFLGSQVRALFAVCGQDFLWLSNGFGFALEPWAMVGKLFDGQSFYPEKAAPTRARILDFWRSLRDALGPEILLRTRGTNLATGIDLGSDASPLMSIYEEITGVETPVNSPWAALDHDFGLELSGWMSRIALHPGASFRFRFYMHDPWWLNSPWLDRYQRQPHDLLLPLSVSRLTASGEVEIPRDLAFLSVDNSHGEMPSLVPLEVSAHLLAARETAPDELGPLVWIYPFEAFHEAVFAEGNPAYPFHADAWVGGVLNEGIPINSIADVGVLARVIDHQAEILNGRIWLAPVPAPGSDYERLLKRMGQMGGNLILFGPIPEASFLLEIFGIALKDPLEGDFSLETSLNGCSWLRHLSILSGGGWREAPDSNKVTGNRLDSIQVTRAGQPRLCLAKGSLAERGSITWVRASLSTAEFDPDHPEPVRGPILRPMQATDHLQPGALLKRALSFHGWSIKGEATPRSASRFYITVHRHRNAFMISGFQPDEWKELLLRFPLGAPLLHRRVNRLHAGHTRLCGQKAWQEEARVFAAASPDGEIEVRELVPAMHGVRRRFLISRLHGAELILLPHPEHLSTLRILRDPKFPYFLGPEVPPEPKLRDGCLIVEIPRATGEILVEW